MIGRKQNVKRVVSIGRKGLLFFISWHLWWRGSNCKSDSEFARPNAIEYGLSCRGQLLYKCMILFENLDQGSNQVKLYLGNKLPVEEEQRAFNLAVHVWTLTIWREAPRPRGGEYLLNESRNNEWFRMDNDEKDSTAIFFTNFQVYSSNLDYNELSPGILLDSSKQDLEKFILPCGRNYCTVAYPS